MNGATSLTLIEPIAERREMALRTGRMLVIDPIAEDQYARADEITGGRGYDVVIDASGSPRAVRGLLDIAAKGATVVYGAMYPARLRDAAEPLGLPVPQGAHAHRRLRLAVRVPPRAADPAATSTSTS